jgi:hypothetical protein
MDAFHTSGSSFTHKTFQRAACGAFEIYLHLFDCPEDIDGLGHLTAAERKKERAKLRKKQQKTEKDVVDGNDETNKKIEVSYFGDCIKESLSWCKYFDQFLSLCECETLSLVSEVHLRRGKLLPAIRGLAAGLVKDKYHPDINFTLVRFLVKLKAKKFTSVPDFVLSMVKDQLSDIAGVDVTASGINSFTSHFIDYASSSESLPHIIAGTSDFVYPSLYYASFHRDKM